MAELNGDTKAINGRRIHLVLLKTTSLTLMFAGTLKDSKTISDSQSRANGHVDEPSPAQQYDHTHNHEDDASGGGWLNFSSNQQLSF